jgi:glycosyltransferase involved in cell wall biosynthesis
MRIVYVSLFEPDPFGNGGGHRAYQIFHDLTRAVGHGKVVNLSYFAWRRDRSGSAAPVAGAGDSGRGLTDRLRAVYSRARRPGVGQVRPEVETRYCGARFIARYRELLAGIEDAALCVIEHPGFAQLAQLNSARGMPTIVCPQNLESFDAVARRGDPRAATRAAPEFAAEYRLLAACDARLFMTAAEAQLCEGLGLVSEVHTYRPVGEVRAVCERVAQRRRETRPDGPAVLLGSGSHHTTRAALEWFLGHAARGGLPRETRVAVVGSTTDELNERIGLAGGVELCGWVSQDALEELLARAPVVLVPQQTGFGSLTKLPELLLSGVPVLASRHAVRAYGDLAGAVALGDDWRQWRDALAAAVRTNRPADTATYLGWEARLADTLYETVMRLLLKPQPSGSR